MHQSATLESPRFTPASTPRPAHPIRKRLWKAAIAIAAVLLVLIVTDVNARLHDPNRKLSLGHDLIPSYAAGVLVRQGNPRGMYDRQAISDVEFRMMNEADLDIGRYGPWLNPPFFAWLFVPLSALPYRQAALVFLIFNVLLFSLCLTLLTRMLARRPAGGLRPPDPEPLDWKTYALVPLLVILPLPFWQVMGHQQNTFISLFLLIAAVMYWRRGQAFAAGLVAGLLFFKPQLAAVFAGILVIALGWRALVGLAVTGTILLAITLLTLPGCLSDFVFKLPPILHYLQVESPYNWGRQVTFQSFWRLLLQGQVRGETVLLVKALWWASCAAVALLLTVAAWRVRNSLRRELGNLSHNAGFQPVTHPADREKLTAFELLAPQTRVENPCHESILKRDGVIRDRLIAAAIVSMPVVMPYYMDYDLMLLCIPAVLLACEWLARPDLITRADRVLFGVWIAFFLESHFNPGLSGGSRFNVAVPLLATISLLHIWRCFRSTPITNDCRSAISALS